MWHRNTHGFLSWWSCFRKQLMSWVDSYRTYYCCFKWLCNWSLDWLMIFASHGGMTLLTCETFMRSMLMRSVWRIELGFFSYPKNLKSKHLRVFCSRPTGGGGALFCRVGGGQQHVRITLVMARYRMDDASNKQKHRFFPSLASSILHSPLFSHRLSFGPSLPLILL